MISADQCLAVEMSLHCRAACGLERAHLGLQQSPRRCLCNQSIDPFCLIPRCLPSSKAAFAFPLTSCQGYSAGCSRSSCDLSGFSFSQPAGEDQKSHSMATQAMKTPTSEQRLKIPCMTETCSPRTSWPTRQSSQSALCAQLYSTRPRCGKWDAATTHLLFVTF